MVLQNHVILIRPLICGITTSLSAATKFERNNHEIGFDDDKLHYARGVLFTRNQQLPCTSLAQDPPRGVWGPHTYYWVSQECVVDVYIRVLGHRVAVSQYHKIMVVAL